MSAVARYVVGDDFVNYALKRDLVKANKAGVFEDMGDDSEQEDRHVSELERRMLALDDKETYIAVKTLLQSHSKTFIKTLYYMKEEGEMYERH